MRIHVVRLLLVLVAAFAWGCGHRSSPSASSTASTPASTPDNAIVVPVLLGSESARLQVEPPPAWGHEQTASGETLFRPPGAKSVAFASVGAQIVMRYADEYLDRSRTEVRPAEIFVNGENVQPDYARLTVLNDARTPGGRLVSIRSSFMAGDKERDSSVVKTACYVARPGARFGVTITAQATVADDSLVQAFERMCQTAVILE